MNNARPASRRIANSEAMNADQLLQSFTQALFLGVFLVAVVRAVRRPLRANVDTALLFGAAVVSIGLTWVQQLGVAAYWAPGAAGALGMSLPYLLLRLLDDFVGVPRALLRLAEVGLACAVLVLFVAEPPLPGWLTVFLVTYFFGFEAYAAVRFLAGARRSAGVTRRRFEAVAAGSCFLALAVLVAGLLAFAPTLAGVWKGLLLVSEVASGIGYAIGFAPPLLLRRAWQEPEVRAFFRSVARLPQLRATGSIVQTLEAGVSAAIGAPHTSIGLWDAAQQVLRFYTRDPNAVTMRVSEQPATTSIISRVFANQVPVFTFDAAREDPPNADAYRAAGAIAVIAVPISVGETRLGVLAAFGPRAFVFAEDDLELVQILANEVALALGYARELVERERVEAEVAERRRAEAALRESEARKAAVIETALDPIISIDHDGRIQEFNPAAERVFACRRSEVMERDFAETIFPPAVRVRYQQHLASQVQAADKTALNQRLEFTAWRADHSEFPIELALVILPSDGPPLLTAFIRDLSERTSARLMQRHLAAIVESSQDAIIGETIDGIVTTWNPGAERLYGYSVSEIVGRPVSRLTPPELSDEVPVLLERLRRGERIQLETIRLTKDARRVDVSLSLSPIEDSDGNIVGAATIARDITGRKRSEMLIRALNADLERRVRDRTAQLEEAVKELEAFSYSVSHDLRAPLRAVNGFSRILLEEYATQLAPEAQGYLRMVGDNAQQMGRLIDDLLAFSRLGRQPLRTQRVSPAEVVRSALDELAPEQEGRRVDIVLGELASCQADPVLLRQVFVNLLSNALKFTRRRDLARVEIGWRELDGAVTYFVKDNGAGFDMRYAHKLFGVFQRLHRAEDYDGTGVGLAIVNRIVHRHGGRAWAESAPDAGATFFFTLSGAAATGSNGQMDSPDEDAQTLEGRTSDGGARAA
jgi:PAS domain S-box-containing protein